MSFIANRLRIIKNILAGYQAPQPFHLYLKGVFAQNKQYGSKDRRAIADYCYAYYRVGRSLPEESFDLRLWAGWLLTQSGSEPLYEMLCETLKLPAGPFEESVEAKLEWLEQQIDLKWTHIFPLADQFNEGLQMKSFIAAQMVRSGLWIRVKKRMTKAVMTYLGDKKMDYKEHNDLAQAVRLPAGTDTQAFPSQIKAGFEIQDISSQRACTFFNPNNGERWWDCCAASGGKSLALVDEDSSVELYVSDVRPQILQNLRLRFEASGIKKYASAVIDLGSPLESQISFKSNEVNHLNHKNHGSFDAIIADVPCSGSGTWRHSPERMLQITEGELQDYQTRQLAIVKNCLPFLRSGGKLIYMTCSVYKAENEQVIALLVKNAGVKLVEKRTIDETVFGGDVMFQAVLVKA
jgi:16S rRNA (cytosine967-C5)-methyltransferase